MIIKHCAIASSDSRGLIADVLTDVAFEHVTFISSRAGALRGNHYHKETTQYVFVLSGKIEAVCRKPGEATVVAILEPFDLLQTDPMEAHALLALEYSTFIVVTRGPRGGEHYEHDTYRLEESLITS